MTLTHQNIKLNKNYVICRTIDGIYKEQVVIIDGKEETEKDIYYSYNYGIFGFHEGFSVLKNIRKLTSQEENDRQKGHYPNNFINNFQSIKLILSFFFLFN